MNSKRTVAYFLIAALIGAGTMGPSMTWAQEQENRGARAKVLGTDLDISVPTPRIDPRELQKTTRYAITVAGNHVPGSIQGSIRQMAEKLRDSEDDAEKEKAQQKLASLLGEYFDQDMTRRQEELTELEQRLEKLRAQLKRREEKRQEIIDLQIKVAVNEADGLGFLSQPMNGPFNWRFDYSTDHSSIPTPAIDISTGDKSIALPTPGPGPTQTPAGDESETNSTGRR